MAFTNFPQGITSQGVPSPSTSIPTISGNYWWVNSATGNAGGPGSVDSPYATIAQAVAVAAVNDCIIIGAGHAETIITATALDFSVAGLQVVGLGEGAKRPTITLGTATTATITVSGASVSIGNIISIVNIDQVASAWTITGASCTLGTPGAPVELQDAATNKEAVIGVTVTGSKFTTNLIYKGQTGGTHCTRGIALNGVAGALINAEFYGKASTAWVNFITVLSSNVEVYGYMYNSGTTNYTKDVVDTITGSLWFASFFDGSAGYAISGGSGSALGPAQAATVIADLAVPSTDSTANLLERDAIGSKADTAVTANGTTVSMMAYQKGLITMSTVIGADSANNAFAGSVVGNKTDAAVQAKSSTGSLVAYNKGQLDVLVGSAGVAAFPAAAAAANAVPIAAVLRYVSELQVPRIAIKTIASASASLTTGLSPVTLFTVTGDVIARVFATVQTGLTSTATTGTLAVGVTGNTASFLPQTTADGTNFPTGAAWAGDTSPTLKSEVFSSTALNGAPIAGSANIICTIATNSMTAGAITFYCQYLPVSSGASVVAA